MKIIITIKTRIFRQLRIIDQFRLQIRVQKHKGYPVGIIDSIESENLSDSVLTYVFIESAVLFWKK